MVAPSAIPATVTFSTWASGVIQSSKDFILLYSTSLAATVNDLWITAQPYMQPAIAYVQGSTTIQVALVVIATLTLYAVISCIWKKCCGSSSSS